MKYIKLIGITMAVISVFTLVFVSTTKAQSFQAGDKITVEKGEVIDSMLFAGGTSIDIAGTVNGDVYCGGQNISISGEVNGDVFCAGQNVTIDGQVNGDIRLAGQTVTISGKIDGSATIGAQNLFIEKGSVIAIDLLGGTETMNINGTIGRDITSGADMMTVNGTVGRDIKGDVNLLTIGSTGLVSGNIDYTSPHDPNIVGSGEVKGSITIYEPVESSAQNSAAAAFSGFMYFAMTAIVIGLVLILAFPKLIDDSSVKAAKKPGMAILVGVLSGILTPIAIIMLIMTLVGIPLAFIAGLLWIILMMISAPFAGYALGKAILFKNVRQPIWYMLAGISLIIIAEFIPLIGFFVVISAYVYGSGMILMQSAQLFARINTKKQSKKSAQQ